ncbi:MULTISPECIES: glycosyltransferase family 2 protein [unclassified Serratia (in: enterobacteria)]|uniref:glycosyltransferase family 2 protein n=1 Tax=unclassified Serratia (in: enterobacteria) TaxID=2647522 RepID=UPI003076631F
MKKIEVILATYNGSNYVKEQVCSILSNFDKLTSFDCKLLISDDGSTDSTGEIIESIKISDNRVSFIDKEKKGGVKANFSFLINKSNADYVFFSDQDDLWLPDKMSIFIEKFSETESNFNGPILIHSDLCVADKNLSPINRSMFKYQNLNKAPSFSQLLVSNSITGCVMACNRELITIIKGSKIKDSIMHDWYIGLCAAAFGKIVFIDKPLILYRQHGGNQVGAKSFALSDLIKIGNIKGKVTEIQESIIRTKKQAELFFSEFSSELSDSKKRLVETYINSFGNSIRYRADLFFNKKFNKNGKLRNLFFFIFYVLKGRGGNV